MAKVAAEACLSRERRFLSLLGRTPLQEIRHVRIERVKRLLAETDLTIYEIAARTGFGGPERLSITFRQATGNTPTDYRGRFRLRA